MTQSVLSMPAAWTVSAAAGVWLGAASALGSRVSLALIGILIVVAVSQRPVVWFVLAFTLLGVLSGLVSAARMREAASAEVPAGRVEATVRIAEDATAATYGLAVGELRALWGRAWDGPRVGVRDLPDGISVGSTITVSGILSPGTRRVRDESVAGVLSVDDVLERHSSVNPLVTGGNLVRESVRSRYDGSHRADGLLAGFLIGDTDLMLSGNQEDLRRAGLSHFVAVSGSNVALFLVIWWVITAPLSIRPRLRKPRRTTRRSRPPRD